MPEDSERQRSPTKTSSPVKTLQCAPLTPFCVTLSSRRVLTASASCSSTVIVVSQLIHASVILTPRFSAASPSDPDF